MASVTAVTKLETFRYMRLATPLGFAEVAVIAYSARMPASPSALEPEPEHGTCARDRAHLDHVLQDQLFLARAQGATQAGQRRRIQELREQQAHRVDQAHREKGERQGRPSTRLSFVTTF